IDAAEMLAKRVGIRISNDKDLALMALSGDTVIGAVWSSFNYDDAASRELGERVHVYDFDIVTEPTARGSLPGPKLIDAALADWRDRSTDMLSYVSVWVVNPKLAAFLEKHY